MKFKFWQKDGFQKEPRLALWGATQEIETFDKYAKLLTCPGCNNTEGFKLVDYERGSNGWELHMICRKCRVTAVLNNTGFHFTGLVKEANK